MTYERVEPFEQLPYFRGCRNAFIMLRGQGFRAKRAMEIAKAWEFLDARKDEVAIVALDDSEYRFDDIDEECFTNKRQLQAYKKKLKNGRIEVFGIGLAFKQERLQSWQNGFWEPDYSTFVWGYEIEISDNNYLRTVIFERMPEFEAYIKEKWASESCL